MPTTPMVCLPFAGAGASFFRPWRALAADRIDIVAPQLPGRERRLEERPYLDVGVAADGILTDVLEQVDNRPLLLFGHSLGAVLAFELGRRLIEVGAPVVRLIVSGSPGPWTRRSVRATGLPDDEFLSRVEQFAGYSHTAMADPAMRELILPTLRSDVRMHEDYVPGSQDPLPIPITSVRGAADQLVSAEQAAEWSKATSRAFVTSEVEGGHMYLTEPVAAGRLLRLVEADLCG